MCFITTKFKSVFLFLAKKKIFSFEIKCTAKRAQGWDRREVRGDTSFGVGICASDSSTAHFCRRGRVYKPEISEGKGNTCCARAGAAHPWVQTTTCTRGCQKHRLAGPLEILQPAHPHHPRGHTKTEHNLYPCLFYWFSSFSFIRIRKIILNVL